jgi:hypothetical protein
VINQIGFDVSNQFSHSSWIFKFDFSQTKARGVGAGQRIGQVGVASAGTSYAN